jgi:hypothetical protein
VPQCHMGADFDKKQVSTTGDIYSSAAVFLVASYGADMNYGLLGISYPRQVV